MKTAQEIRKGMTQGEWVTDFEDNIISDNDKSVADTLWGENGDYECNAAAICTAVNNTYGQNIDPAKVPEMVHMLETILGYQSPVSELYPDIKSLLTSAKLK